MRPLVIILWCLGALLLSVPIHGLLGWSVYFGLCGIGCALDYAFFPKWQR